MQARVAPRTRQHWQPRVERQTGNPGAVLIFLQGWDAIANVCNMLMEPDSPFVNLAYAVLPLHGQLPYEEQRLVFEPARPGVRKIVLATNIAESAVTIPGACRVCERT